MVTLIFICLAFAFVCFAIAAFWNPQPPPRVHLISAGLAFWVLAEILGHAGLK